jgi:2-phosphoglycerate kinase
MTETHPWYVLLFGGASGVGKTSVSYRLARHFGVGLTEVDDFQVILERMTSPERYPEFHYWRLHTDEALRMTEDEHLDFGRRYVRAMAPALELVIANHIETRMPVVLEGDFIHPELAVRPSYGEVEAGGRVRAVFLYEEDEEQIARNYLEREGEEQPRRARLSWRYSEWLRREAERVGVTTIAARPWDTVLERIIAVLDPPGAPPLPPLPG